MTLLTRCRQRPLRDVAYPKQSQAARLFSALLVGRAPERPWGVGAFMPTRRISYRRRQPSSASLPYVEPIALVPRADPFDDPEWIFEPKYDGFRGLAYSSGSGCEIRSRRDIPLRRFEDLWSRLSEVLRGREAILDGEIVALDRRGKPVFDSLIRREGFIAFAAFDLLWLDGKDLRRQPLVSRKELLASLLPEDTGPLYKVLAIEEHGRALFGAA
ncbi:MAG TPA: hypothetical protein VIJ61_06395, partial [Thermoanaerobaculia bacterium]